jgi:NAD(P)-dependent dehydrogenase (short-subunit alcohol dehydrogenase family)
MSHDTHDRAVFGKNIFAGRTAFITGGTSGINLAIARGLAACGARLALLGRDPGKAERAVEEVSALGPQALALTADVRDFAALDQAVGIAADHLGPLDFVIAGAAGNFIAPAENLSANGFKAVVEIDLMGSFHIFRAAFPHLRTPGASLLAISSGQAFNPVWGQAHASAAKAGIRVNSLCPGPIAGTEGVDRLIDEKRTRELTARLPARRYGRHDEIANAAIFLLSSAASYVSGTTLHCDGGMLLAGYDGQPAN